MNQILSPSFWLSTFASVLITIVIIVLIKRVSTTVDIPILSGIVSEV